MECPQIQIQFPLAFLILFMIRVWIWANIRAGSSSSFCPLFLLFYSFHSPNTMSTASLVLYVQLYFIIWPFYCYCRPAEKEFRHRAKHVGIAPYTALEQSYFPCVYCASLLIWYRLGYAVAGFCLVMMWSAYTPVKFNFT